MKATVKKLMDKVAADSAIGFNTYIKADGTLEDDFSFFVILPTCESDTLDLTIFTGTKRESFYFIKKEADWVSADIELDDVERKFTMLDAEQVSSL